MGNLSFCVLVIATFEKVKSSKTVYTSQKTPPRRDHGASPDFRFAYKHCRILHFLRKSKKVKSDFYVFTVKVNENGGFRPPEDGFGSPWRTLGPRQMPEPQWFLERIERVH